MPKSPRLESSQEMKQIATEYYQGLARAVEDPNQKVAWCSSVGPAELLLSMGFNVYYPENHTAMLGATRTANKFIPVSVAQGYSPEICSYLTSDIGAYLSGETPLMKAYGIDQVPEPDVLVYNTNQCRDVGDWFSWYAKKLDVPILGIHSPSFVDEVTSSHIHDVVEQFKQMILDLEQITDQKFEQNELQRRVKLSLDCTNLWMDVLDTAANTPSPISFFDACIQMLPAVVLRGEQVAIDYYEHLLRELKERIENGVGAAPNEQYRTYWEGMPIWGKLRALSDQFIDLQTCVVASTYCSSWVFTGFGEFPNNPLAGMAKAYTELFINRSDSAKENYLREEFDKFHVDGVVWHNARTCPNNSNTRYGMPNRLERELTLPNLLIDADLNDLNVYSEEQTRMNIEAFVEQLAGI